MRKIYIPFFICLLFLHCTKEEILLPAEEPDITNPAEDIITGDFTVFIESKTEQSLLLKWSPVENAIIYEVVLNDLILVSEIKSKDIGNDYFYNLVNLEPDTEYKVTIRAFSKDLHVKSASGTARTLIGFISKIITVELDKYDYEFKGCTHFMEAKDGGSLLLYNVNKQGQSYRILIKLNPSYETTWICEIPEPYYEVYYFYTEPYFKIHETKNGDFIITTNRGLAKVSHSGVLVWKKDITEDESYFNSSVLLPDESLILGGYSRRERQNYVVIGYYMVKVSVDGNLIWENHVEAPDNSSTRRYVNALTYDQGKLLGAVWSDNASVVEFDLEGNILNEYIYNYPDDYMISFSNILPAKDGNYYLVGIGYYAGNRSYVIKIDGNGRLLWEKRGHEDEDYNTVPFLSNTVNDGSVLVFSYTHIYEAKVIDITGNTIKQFRLSNFPTAVYIGQCPTGEYLYVSLDGDIIFINPDRY